MRSTHLILALLTTLALFACEGEQTTFVEQIEPGNGTVRNNLGAEMKVIFSDDVKSESKNGVSLTRESWGGTQGITPRITNHDELDSAVRTNCALCHDSGETNSTVQLWGYFARTVTRSITGASVYDAASATITMTPTSSLQRGTQYLFDTSKVKDFNSDQVITYNSRFKTLENPVSVSVRYTDGELSECIRHEFRVNSSLGNRHIYTSGAIFEEDQWNCDDATITAYSEDILSSSGRHVRTVHYAGAGDNGTWLESDNNDDVIESYVVFSFNDNQQLLRLISYNDPGEDGKWINADDVIQEYRQFEYDDGDNLTQTLVYTDAGDDGEWINADDVVNQSLQHTKIEHLDSGNQLVYRYASPADTVAMEIYELAFNSNGALAKQTNYAVVDGNKGSVTSTIDYAYNSNQLLETKTQLDENGARIGQTQYQYNERGALQRVSNHGVDDSNANVSSYTQYTLNSRDQTVSEVSYTSAGDNSVWFDADDAIGTHIEYEYAEDDLLTTRSIKYSGAGEENILEIRQYDTEI